MSDLRSMDDPAALLAGIHRMMRRRLRAGTTGAPLRGAQVELLRLVYERPGVGVSAAARELYLAGNTVSTLVNELVTAGLLRREVDRLDRRAARLYPTVAAERRLAAWEKRRGALFRERLELLDEDDRAAVEAALPALRRLAEGLRDASEEPRER